MVPLEAEQGVRWLGNSRRLDPDPGRGEAAQFIPEDGAGQCSGCGNQSFQLLCDGAQRRVTGQPPLAASLEQPHTFQPSLELRRRAFSEGAADIQRIMERRALVIQHHIIRAGDAHDKRTASRAKQGQKGVHVVLIGLRMVGITDVAAHRQAEQLAAAMVLQAGPDNLLAIVEIFRADKPDDGVDQQRREGAGNTIGSCLQGLLVHAVMGIGGESTALAGLKVHHIVADRAAPQSQGHLPRLAQHGERDAKAGVRGLRPSNGLEHQVHRGTALHRLHGIGHMGQNAGLRGHVEANPQLIEHREQTNAGVHIVRRRIDPDHRIPAPKQQAVEEAGRDPKRIVGGVIGLHPCREPSREADGVAEPRDDPALGPDQNQVLQPHDLGDGRRHLRGQARSEPCQRFGVGGIRQEPVPQTPDCQVGDDCKRRPVMRIHDQPRDFVGFVGNDDFGQKRCQRQIRQRHLCRHALLRAACSQARQNIA